MKKHNRIISSIFIIAILISVFALPVNASTLKYQFANSSAFGVDAWENVTEYKRSGITIGQMKWGYDTEWVDENYCKARGNSSSCKAMLYRSNVDSTYQEGSLVNAYEWSTIYRNDRNTDVYFYIFWSTTYSGTINENTIYGW